MKKLIVAGALAATLLTGSAYAGQDRPSRDPFASADANGDGVITREEYLAGVDARFAKMDANKDGKISADERPQMGGRMMGHGDGNGDGAITLEEMRAQSLQRFDRLDTNKDGKIDQAERQSAMDRMKQFMSMRGGHGRHAPEAPADQPAAPQGN